MTIDVHAPAAYQALHTQLLDRTGGQADGLLVHLARPTADGATADPPVPAISVTQIDVSGLVIPRGPVAF